MAQKTIDFENDILGPIGSLKEDLADLKDNKITKFYTNNNGDTVLNDSDDGKIQDLIIYGKSEQKQYTEKNLLNYEKWKTVNIENGTAVYENNGVTLTAIGDDAYTDYRDEKSKILVTVGKTYILSWESEQIEGSRAFIFPNGMIANSVEVKNEKQVKYTVPVGIDYITFRVGVLKKGQTISFKNIMFEEGSERTDFEPYTGGKPSPSPEYPQEIKAVVNPVIKTHGKNLIDTRKARSGTVSGVTFTVNPNDGSITMRGTATETVANLWFLGRYNVNPYTNPEGIVLILKKGKTYNIRDCILYTVTNNGEILAYFPGTTSKLSHDLMFTAVRAINLTVGHFYNDEMLYPLVAETDVTTDWQPYQETQATLPYELYAIPVSSGGNVTIDGQQYIADYVDVEKGVLVRRVFRKVLKNAVGYELIGKNNLFFWDISEYASGNNGYCNHYIADGVLNDKHFRADNTRVYIRDDSITSLSEFNSRYENGLEVAYILRKHTETNLTPEEVQAFKALATYYPKTYVTTESEQLEAYTMFNYPVSMEKGWEYVKQQIGDTRKYVYDMDLQSAEAYVNSEYAVALTELEV